MTGRCASRRSAALRAEPQKASQAEPAVAIARRCRRCGQSPEAHIGLEGYCPWTGVFSDEYGLDEHGVSHTLGKLRAELDELYRRKAPKAAPKIRPGALSENGASIIGRLQQIDHLQRYQIACLEKALGDAGAATELVESGLRVAMVASCDCNHPASISPDPEGHEMSCRYRVLWTAADKAADLRAIVIASADTRPEGGDSTEIEAPFTSGAVAKPDARKSHD